jgi:signal transduction histidine kinase
VANTSSLPGEFPHRIGRSLIAGFGFIIAAIILLGGVSVFLTSRIYRNQEAVAQEYLHLVYLEKIDLVFDNIIFEIQQKEATDQIGRSQAMEALQAELMQHLVTFRDAHQQRVGSAWNSDEQTTFAALWQTAGELQPLTRRMLAAPSAFRQLAPPDIQRFTVISQELRRKVEELSDLHRRQETELLQNSQRMLQGIVALYLALIPTGGFLIVATSIIFRRRMVTPLRALADTALGIAEGRTDRRVPVYSRDEFGQVSYAFNIMAERVETREREIADLHMGLQDKVLERTRELEEAMRRLMSTQEALVRTERAAVVGQVAAAVTHGIRTPLSALAINLQLIRRALDRQALSPERVRPLLSTADLEVDRINRTLEEFVHYSRLPKPRLATVDCNALIQQVAAFLQAHAEEARVTITLRCEDDLPSIQGDGDQLREALLNLTSNAIQAMPNGGQLNFETCRTDDDQAKAVMLRITDTGRGIAPEDLPHIFESFFSTKGKGLGLGLPIALRIVEEHGGTIHCRSREGEGTTFEVILPGFCALDAQKPNS